MTALYLACDVINNGSHDDYVRLKTAVTAQPVNLPRKPQLGDGSHMDALLAALQNQLGTNMGLLGKLTGQCFFC